MLQRFVRGFSALAGKAKGLQIPGIKDIIAVASGKGGVGKSTTAGVTLFSILFFFDFWRNFVGFKRI